MTRPAINLPVTVAAALLLSGCYFNTKAPVRYYRAPVVNLDKSPVYVPGALKKQSVRAGRALVMPVWSSLVTNPVGGLYDRVTPGITPLHATFFHPDIVVPIWESAAKRLGDHGFRIFKDYGAPSAKAALSALRGKDGLLLQGRLLRLSHDQQRNTVEQVEIRYEAVWAEITLSLVDGRGNVKWRKKVRVYSKKAVHHKEDLLEALGHAAADAMMRDPLVHRLINNDAPTQKAQTLASPAWAARRGPALKTATPSRTNVARRTSGGIR